MDKLDMCLIPFIYLLLTTLIILSEFTFTVHTSSIIGRELKSTLTWMTISGMNLIPFALSGIHSLIQFKVIQYTLSMMLQRPLPRTIIFWPNFYYSFFKYKKGRCSIWSIATNPLGADYRILVRPSNKITCLNARYYCYSFYQANGAYDQLHQQSDKDIEYSVSSATAVVFYDDILNLEIP